MKLMKAIENADALCPNPYTLEEKIGWCDEVNAEIRRNILKRYDIIETTCDSYGNLILPMDITPDLIEVVKCNGHTMSKQDFRSFIPSCEKEELSFGNSNKMQVVYLTLPERIRYIDIRGEFNVGENYIEMDLPPFREGDLIEIREITDTDISDTDSATYTDDNSILSKNVKTAYVIEADVDKIILDHDVLTPETGAKLAIQRVIDDLTEVDEAPYDSMYTEYLLAKAALYQHDYAGYNAHMTQYQCLFESMRREMQSRCPLTTQVRFKNYGII